MEQGRVSRRYLRLRLALALGSAFLAALVSQQITRSLSNEVIARSEIADALDDVQLSIADLMAAFIQIRLATDSQRADLVRSDLGRGARRIIETRDRLRRVVARGGADTATLSILEDPILDPLRMVEDVAMVAMAAGSDSSPFGHRADRIASAGLDLSKRVLPVFKRLKETEREALEAASLRLSKGGWWTLAMSGLVLVSTAVMLFLPLERRILTAQAEIERRREAAERASAAKTDFLATMSHEIRTPMNGVLGMADVLRTTGLDARQRAMVDIIVQSGKALMDIINGVLDLARIEAGHLDLVLAPFDLRQVAEEVVALFSGAAATKGIALAATLDPALAEQYEGDAGALRQVLSNLVGNAVKFTEAGSITVRIAPQDGHGLHNGVRIEVRDTGVGIPTEAHERIFESFQQADATTTRRFGGSGLGLAIVNRLVSAMGGAVTVASAPGLGATFSVVLPLRAIEPLPAAADWATGRAAAPRDLTGLRVLVAEDNSVNQAVVGAMLARFGCRVVLASDGVEAVEAFRTARPDAILMDVSMPRLDGHGATAAIRVIEAETGAEPVAIIGLSAHALADAQSNGQISGMDAFLTKPVSLTALASALRRHAGRPAPGRLPGQDGADGAPDAPAPAPTAARTAARTASRTASEAR